MDTKPNLVRKSVRLDQEKLTRAKEILGTRTETEAIAQALDAIVLRREIMDGITRLRELGVYDHLEGDDVFAPLAEP